MGINEIRDEQMVTVYYKGEIIFENEWKYASAEVRECADKFAADWYLLAECEPMDIVIVVR